MDKSVIQIRHQIRFPDKICITSILHCKNAYAIIAVGENHSLYIVTAKRNPQGVQFLEGFLIVLGTIIKT